MRNLYIVFFALALVALLYAGHYRAFAEEGFAVLPSVRKGNYILDLMGQLKRTSATLANPTLWGERLALVGKSPTELARAYIKSQSKQE
jgi:hypothetical protein